MISSLIPGLPRALAVCAVLLLSATPARGENPRAKDQSQPAAAPASTSPRSERAATGQAPGHGQLSRGRLALVYSQLRHPSRG